MEKTEKKELNAEYSWSYITQDLKSVLNSFPINPGTKLLADRYEIMRTKEFLVVQKCVYKSLTWP